jgi:hypothetical protein
MSSSPPRTIDVNGRQLPFGFIVFVLVGIFVIVVGWASVYTVEAESEGVVLRFGKLLKTVEPGLHFKLPLGIDVVTLVPTRRQLKLEFGFSTPGRTNPDQAGEEPEREKSMVTGDLNVLDRHHFEVMKDGAIISNSGHFNVEINIPALDELSSSKRLVRPFVEEYNTKDGRRIYLLGEGRLINLAAAEGHPASVMDMSFANQALSAEYMLKNAATLEKKVYGVPDAIDREIARLKLEAMRVSIDTLTAQQVAYLGSWEEGT